jgi:uncharacterized protein YndB with AHSA1/START domain
VSDNAPTSSAVHVYRIYIKASPQAIWDAITRPERTVRYGYAPLVEYDLRPGGAFRAHANEGMKAFPEIPDVIGDGEVLEVDPPHRLVQTWRMTMTPELAAEAATRLTWESAVRRVSAGSRAVDAPTGSVCRSRTAASGGRGPPDSGWRGTARWCSPGSAARTASCRPRPRRGAPPPPRRARPGTAAAR